MRGSSASASDTTNLRNFFFSEKIFFTKKYFEEKKIFTWTPGSVNNLFTRRSCNEAAEVGRP